ncbi:MAG TPA: DUF3576 domain-containing protein [Stellaceae bacterium]|jgi:uncharacterized protein DUF3576|nr:DUF3576 domain-containing protein [Stellaceae bacterium]
MSAPHYRLLPAVAASLSLMLAALMLAACGSSPPAPQATAPPGAGGSPQDPANVKAAADAPAEMDTEATIWTVLGLAKKPSEHQPGPRTGSTVSPILWQAALDTLGFAKFSTQDPLTGELVTEWYSPKDKPDERYKIDVFVLAPTVRSDAVAVTVDRQERSATGQWTETTVARKVEDDLETAILRRAGELKRDWMKAYASK